MRVKVYHWNMQQLFPLVDIAQDVRTKDTPTMGHICSHLWKPIWSQHFELMPFNALMTSSSSLFCGKKMLTVMANSEVAVLPQASWCIFHWKTPCPGPSRCGGAKCEPSKNPFLQHSNNTTKHDGLIWPGSIYLLPKNFEKSPRTQIRRDPMVPLTIATRLGVFPRFFLGADLLIATSGISGACSCCITPGIWPLWKSRGTPEREGLGFSDFSWAIENVVGHG